MRITSTVSECNISGCLHGESSAHRLTCSIATWGHPDLVGVHVVLAVVFPAALVTDLESSTGFQGQEPAAGTGVRTAARRAYLAELSGSHHTLSVALPGTRLSSCRVRGCRGTRGYCRRGSNVRGAAVMNLVRDLHPATVVTPDRCVRLDLRHLRHDQALRQEHSDAALARTPVTSNSGAGSASPPVLRLVVCTRSWAVGACAKGRSARLASL